MALLFCSLSWSVLLSAEAPLESRSLSLAVAETAAQPVAGHAATGDALITFENRGRKGAVSLSRKGHLAGKGIGRVTGKGGQGCSESTVVSLPLYVFG